jgi:hypothetical protein
LLAPVLRASGPILLRTAVRALHFERRIAYRCYVLALGCTDLAGYSRACTHQALQRRAKQDARAIGAQAREPTPQPVVSSRSIAETI